MRSIMPIDQEFPYSVWHKLSPKEAYNLHWHPIANEWIIIDTAEFKINLAGTIIDVGLKIKHRSYIVVHFEPGENHALAPTSEIEYLVIRDVEDEIIDCF